MRRVCVTLLAVIILMLCFNVLAQTQPSSEPEVIVPSSMWDKIKSTGFTGFVLLFVSVIGLSYTLERTFNLRQD